jgi:hypothetical protein
MQTWKEETPEDRAVFIGTLEVKLSPADEPLLEAALDDKRKEVRRTAANLLACLPDSAFVKRATDRVRPLLKFVPGSAGGLLKLKKAKPAALEVTLPAECDRAMQRDGVEPKPLPGLGEKAWWLIQMLEAVPLVRWQGEWDLPVDEILAASHAGEWKKEFFEAWTRAAIRQKNETWAQALLDLAIDTKRLDKLDGLLAAMSPARREGHLTRLLLNDDDKFRDLQGTLIAQCRHEWSATFSRAVLAFMQGVAAQELGNWQLRNHFKTFAPRLDPGVLAETVSGWPTDSKGWDFWSKGVEEFLAATQFRSDLHHAFSQ